MLYPEWLAETAPCGLICYNCASYDRGPIAAHAQGLARWLEGFAPFATRFAAFEPRLGQYPAFADVLALLAQPPCGSCRQGQGCMPGCVVRACTAERGHAFCAACDEFPCGKVDFEGQLREAWLRGNARIREIGAEAFWRERRETSHYLQDAAL